MTDPYGGPPRSGWPRLMVELLVQDFTISLSFWRDVLGFGIAYQRPVERFVYLEHPDGAQIMLCQRHGQWETGPLQRPYGRGLMLQVYVRRLDPVIAALTAMDWPIHTGLRETWRRVGDRESGQLEVFVQDPDGYLLMVAEEIGERPLN
ncbi:VOC family protein [Ferrovibrio terrae]|uniref:VOC family protein n=1 Tax=Ferrovibrio terrae TaxID=2594003 RepID=UPI003137F24B